MSKPLVSVIVPVYNVEEFLDECVESIVNQTYKNLEIILIDDGSMDLSSDKCDEWADKDNRIKVIHKENSGAAASRNVGLEIASGEYIGFVDSDDYIKPDMFEVMVNALQNTEKKMVSCSAFCVLGDGTLIEESKKPSNNEMNVKQALEEIFTFRIGTAVWRRLFERSVFEKIRFPEGVINEDYPLIIPTTVEAGGIKFVNQALYYYRQREGSVTDGSGLKEKNCDNINKNLNKMEAQLQDYGLLPMKSFDYFKAASAYSLALLMEKNFNSLNVNVIKSYEKYRCIMKANSFNYIFSKYSKFKDKILYLLVITKLLRPLYKLLNKQL